MRYRILAVHVLNTLLLFVLVNVVAWLALELRPASRVSPAYDGLMARGLDTLRAVYPGMEDEAIEALLRESWTLPLVYEPYTQFREAEVRGRWVNVAREGYRWNGAGSPAWPPVVGRDLFVFGGSTAFGYGLPDSETLAAALEVRLGEGEGRASPAVYNFGRAYYNSTQERVLFERLLSRGHVPRAAIFLDGLNDTLLWPRYRDAPQHTEALAELVEKESLNTGWGSLARGRPAVELGLHTLPAVRLARRLLRRLAPDAQARRQAYEVPPGSQEELEEEAAELAAVYARNLALARAAGREHGADTYFVLQPVPWHAWDVSRHLFAPPAEQVSGLQRRFDAAYAALRRELGDQIVDCSGVLTEHDGPTYLDAHHYTAAAIERLAGCIAGALSAQPGEPASATPPVAE